jgi:hypothetical protein
MRITLDIRKSLEENAAMYFERAKKAKRKLEGAKKALALAQERVAATEAKHTKEPKETAPKREKAWFEKLRWFVTSDGFLCIGGRDATTNEMVMKKHAAKGDMVFHTDMAGSPFVIVKAEGKEIPEDTLEEAAQFCACYSRAWKSGFGYLEVFCAPPEQFSKEPQSGEFLPKGAFVVRGHIRYFKPALEICVTKDDQGRVMAAPERAAIERTGSGYQILQGNEKISDIAKRLAKQFDADVDDIVAVLPPGGVKLGRLVRGMKSHKNQNNARDDERET